VSQHGLGTEQTYSSTNLFLTILGILSVAVPVGVAWRFTAAAGAPAGILVMGLILVTLILLLSRVAVSLGPDAIGIELGPIGWRVLEIPYEQVEAVEVIRASPAKWNGWRTGLFWPLSNGIIVRSGEAVLIKRSGGEVVVVTVDRASQAVNTIRERAGLA